MDAVEVMYRHFALRDFRSKGHHADEWSVCSATVEGPTMRRLRLQIIAFSLSALGVTAFDPGPAFSQTPPPPVTLPVGEEGGLDTDFADLKLTQDLNADIKNAHLNSW